MGLEPMTPAIMVQCSTNYTNKPTCNCPVQLCFQIWTRVLPSLASIQTGPHQFQWKDLSVMLHSQLSQECLACKQAPSWRQAQQKFGAKRRASGACTHLPEYPMSTSKFWTQSGDWWILIIHDVILVFSSGRDKNQNGGKERCSSSQSLSPFIN